MGSPDVTVGHETDLEEVGDELVETELENVSKIVLPVKKLQLLEIFKILIPIWNQL